MSVLSADLVYLGLAFAAPLLTAAAQPSARECAAGALLVAALGTAAFVTERVWNTWHSARSSYGMSSLLSQGLLVTAGAFAAGAAAHAQFLPASLPGGLSAPLIIVLGSLLRLEFPAQLSMLILEAAIAASAPVAAGPAGASLEEAAAFWRALPLQAALPGAVAYCLEARSRRLFCSMQ